MANCRVGLTTFKIVLFWSSNSFYNNWFTMIPMIKSSLKIKNVLKKKFSNVKILSLACYETSFPVPGGYSLLFSHLHLKEFEIWRGSVALGLQLVDCVYTRFKWEKFYNPEYFVLEDLKVFFDSLGATLQNDKTIIKNRPIKDLNNLVLFISPFFSRKSNIGDNKKCLRNI
ncbi:hypothetical protein BpHYR1_028059 [Brachionus plicatilis]|uniref:Uncharacterized protein n=1 Tax=Brachionus plicatilis TaxID=10195 RepID=A0A3M7SP62_BRAPC|nr:hypothetical protein BpHYR1_028059 [Brachionus plicatilis]